MGGGLFDRRPPSFLTTYPIRGNTTLARGDLSREDRKPIPSPYPDSFRPSTGRIARHNRSRPPRKNPNKQNPIKKGRPSPSPPPPPIPRPDPGKPINHHKRIRKGGPPPVSCGIDRHNREGKFFHFLEVFYFQ